MKTDKLLIYLEKKKAKVLVGTLERKNSRYLFTYDDKYFYSNDPMELGPELPLKKKQYTSKKLFNFFLDRLPKRKNAAYADYCEQVEIDVNEKDEMVLLSTLGTKGPSSFVIESVQENIITSKHLKDFRHRLNLSMRDFANLFDISLSTIQRIENDKTSGKEVLKRLELYIKFPEVARYEILKNKAIVHSFVVSDALDAL